MEEENWINKYQSNFYKFQKTVNRVVEIIEKIFEKFEECFRIILEKPWKC